MDLAFMPESMFKHIQASMRLCVMPRRALVFWTGWGRIQGARQSRSRAVADTRGGDATMDLGRLWLPGHRTIILLKKAAKSPPLFRFLGGGVSAIARRPCFHAGRKFKIYQQLM
jgi:hypothetical protein